MDIKIVLIIAFSYLYAFFELFLGMWQKRNRTQQIVKSGDKASIWILIILIVLGYSFSFWIGTTKLGRIYHWNTFFAIGVVLILTGLVIRIKSILTLKQHFTYTVTKIENHELIETGLYKLIRHPGYLGQLIIFTGTAVSLSNWISVILMIIAVLTGFMYRIKVEEQFMLVQMGKIYSDYQKRTKRLIPFIF